MYLFLRRVICVGIVAFFTLLVIKSLQVCKDLPWVLSAKLLDLHLQLSYLSTRNAVLDLASPVTLTQLKVQGLMLL